MATIDLPDPDDHFERYLRINHTMWSAVERGELQPGEVRHRRFEQFVDEVGIDTDPHAMADAFVWGLGAYGELYDGVYHSDPALYRESLARLRELPVTTLFGGHYDAFGRDKMLEIIDEYLAGGRRMGDPAAWIESQM